MTLKLRILILFIGYSLISMAQNTPPSCVITAPHCNAYFDANTDIHINVYASDMGGSESGGSVTKVEIFNDDVSIGQLSSSTSNTYAFLWENVPVGEYRIVAKATDNNDVVSESAGVLITVGSEPAQSIGMSAGKGKYLGNIMAGYIPSKFNTYWNGVTAENECKWGTVERNRDVMNWEKADVVYNHAKYNHLMFRYHALAWGSQYPGWIEDLNTTEFKEEMEEYMAAIAERYPYIDQFDVLNENMYKNTWNGKEHAAGTPFFREGMGGAGTTGYDWVIWLFEKAREYFPNSKLIMNDFELENNTDGINEMLEVIKVLRDRGLIDGFGTQAHHFNLDGLSSSRLNSSLNLMAQSGLPIYVTELDLKGAENATENNQLTSYKNLFPVYWNHPAVAGISLWGYIEGATWSDGTGILNENGSERKAMTWLKSFMEEQTVVGYPFGGAENTGSTDNNILINGEFNQETHAWGIENYNGAQGTMEVLSDLDMSGENALQICVETTGNHWEVQVWQTAPFSAGKKYEISFMAKSETPRNLTFAMQENGNPYTIYLEETLALTESKQSFSFSFQPTESDATNRLKFFVGDNTSCVSIDSLVFKETDETSSSLFLVQDKLQIYPNPVTTQTLHLSNSGEQLVSASIYSLVGEHIKTVSFHENNGEIDLSEIRKGMYLLNVKTPSQILSRKIIIQ